MQQYDHARRRRRACIFIGVPVLAILAIALGVGLGVGLRSSDDTASTAVTSTAVIPTGNATIKSSIWYPNSGTTWEIQLLNPVTDYTQNVSVYDLDLFDNTAETIAQLQAAGKRVICYCKVHLLL